MTDKDEVMLNCKHGSPRDRGMADSYYRRGRWPHKIDGGIPVSLKQNTPEWDDYMWGYQRNEEIGNFKDWGNEHA